jgi:hypothetical protein
VSARVARWLVAVAVVVAVTVALDPWGHAPRHLAHPPITSTGLTPAGPAGPYGPLP